MKFMAAFIRRMVLAVLIIFIGFYGDGVLGLCDETNVLDLENKILSLADKGDRKFDLEAFDDAIDKIDTLSVEKATFLLLNLCNYYLGEGGASICLEKVTKIGDKILPYLVQMRNEPKIKCKNEYKELCLTIEQRNILIDRALKGIKEGIVLYSVFPEKLGNEAVQYLTVLHIFIEDFRKQRGNLPQNLQELKEYGWIRYGYKIKIINPWGKPYKYIVQKSEYRVEVGERP